MIEGETTFLPRLSSHEECIYTLLRNVKCKTPPPTAWGLTALRASITALRAVMGKVFPKPLHIEIRRGNSRNPYFSVISASYHRTSRMSGAPDILDVRWCPNFGQLYPRIRYNCPNRFDIFFQPDRK